MFAIICRRRLRVTPKNSIFVGPQFCALQNAILVKSFSSQKSSSDVHRDDPKQSFTVSYLINSCGLSSKDAISVSKRLKRVRIKSPEKPDAVLELLREYGFTNAHIPRLVTRWPLVLVACPNKTLLPKLEFFRSIGVPVAVLAEKLSVYPLILQRSLKSYLIPLYNYLKSLLQSDKRVVNVFSRAPRAFAHGWQREISSNIAILRERGVPESSIVLLVMYQPSLLIIDKKKLAVYVDRKIMANMDFLVSKLGCKPVAVAQCPVLLGLNLDKRMKPRCLVARILNEKGLLKKTTGVTTLLTMSEEKFLKRYIVDYQEDIPELLDIYQGKLSLPDMGFSQKVISK
ncbi:hypothetical protein Pfo_006190 [Paulownia fortunei]|nr:hypothetical protein Pfo_006190 [Paulownia fortunei]